MSSMAKNTRRHGKRSDRSFWNFFEDVKGAVNNKPLFPNIETSPRERAEMNNYIDKELLLRGRSLVDKPFALANQYEMDAAYTSATAGIVQYPPGIIKYADTDRF